MNCMNIGTCEFMNIRVSILLEKVEFLHLAGSLTCFVQILDFYC